MVSLKRALENIASAPSQENQDAYEYHLKMFAAIFKSALRDLAAHISDEFMSHVVELRTIPIIKAIDEQADSHIYTKIREKFMALIISEHNYKLSQGYGVMNDDASHNRNLVFHRGMLKKYIESELYIRLDKKKDGVAVLQLKVQKLYHVNIVFQLQHDNDTEYHHFLISMTRNGVIDITKTLVCYHQFDLTSPEH